MQLKIQPILWQSILYSVIAGFMFIITDALLALILEYKSLDRFLIKYINNFLDFFSNTPDLYADNLLAAFTIFSTVIHAVVVLIITYFLTNLFRKFFVMNDPKKFSLFSLIFFALIIAIIYKDLYINMFNNWSEIQYPLFIASLINHFVLLTLFALLTYLFLRKPNRQIAA